MTIEVGSQWYNKIATEISQYKITLGEKGAKQYKIDLLLRVAKRVDEFSNICAECQAYKQEIANLVNELSMLVQMPSKQGLKNHNAIITRIVEHLKKTHKLVDKGYHIGISMAIGAGVGAALGAAFDNPAIGTPLGIGIGVAVGAYLDKKARDEDRII